MRLGIDFGTTRTVVAVHDRGNYPVVAFSRADGDLGPTPPPPPDPGLVGLIMEPVRIGGPANRSRARTLPCEQPSGQASRRRAALWRDGGWLSLQRLSEARFWVAPALENSTVASEATASPAKRRASTVPGAEREKVIAEHGEAFANDPMFYDSFFVPWESRWQYLVDNLNAERYATLLNTALTKLGEHNGPLEGVLDHIDFMKQVGNKRVINDEDCRALARHFNRYRFRNGDFQFSDLLGAAYEFLINMFAESAGKKGGDFYTPRDVVRLMVRLLKPQQGMSVYDPTCGSGGMLILSKEYVEQCGGDSADMRLAGQVLDVSAWTICKLNMILHGIPDAHIEREDTLLHPLHREAGELEHAAAILHPKLGAPLRAAVEKGAALVPSAKKQGGVGTAVDVPLGHKDAAFVRSHFDAMEARVADAPRAHEIVVAVVVTDSGRPLPRIGGLQVAEIKGQDGLR